MEQTPWWGKDPVEEDVMPRLKYRCQLLPNALLNLMV
jgi:hypothetical protein